MINRISIIFLSIFVVGSINACAKIEKTYLGEKASNSTNNTIKGETTKPSDNIATPSPVINPKKGYVMPNVNWETRSINGITYVFGEGNPQEVALDSSEGMEIDYVTPKSELLIKEFLTDSSLKTFVDQCGDKLGLTNDNTMLGFNITKSEDLDINKLLLVDENTGRKKLDNEKVYAISQLLWNVTNQLNGDSAITACMNEKEVIEFNKLSATFDSMTSSYLNYFKKND